MTWNSHSHYSRVHTAHPLTLCTATQNKTAQDTRDTKTHKVNKRQPPASRCQDYATCKSGTALRPPLSHADMGNCYPAPASHTTTHKPRSPSKVANPAGHAATYFPAQACSAMQATRLTREKAGTSHTTKNQLYSHSLEHPHATMRTPAAASATGDHLRHQNCMAPILGTSYPTATRINPPIMKYFVLWGSGSISSPHMWQLSLHALARHTLDYTCIRQHKKGT